MYKMLIAVISFLVLTISIGGIIFGIRYYQVSTMEVVQIVKNGEEQLALKDERENVLSSGETDLEQGIKVEVETDSELEADTKKEVVSEERKNESVFENMEEDTVKDNDVDVKEKNTYYIKINKEMNTVTIYGLDEDGEYSVPIKAMVCSAGWATPLGTFNTSDKYTWRLLKGNVWGQYSTRITKNILFHSVPNSRKSKSSLISKYYNKLGTTASAGCVRLTVEDAKWIIDNCPSGTSVEIYNDSNPGPLGKPIPITVPVGTKWDPTDPDPNNPWLEKAAVITGVKDHTIKQYEGVNPLDGVIALDRFGNNITSEIVVSGGVDTTTTGIYEISYKITDNMGSTVAETATYSVIEKVY